MADGVRVRMVVRDDHPGVHDGAGGVHKAGATPTLPADVAAIFIERGFAVAFGAGEGAAAETQRVADVAATNLRAEGYKELASEVMRNHDDLSAEKRSQAYAREVTGPIARTIAAQDAGADVTLEQMIAMEKAEIQRRVVNRVAPDKAGGRRGRK